MISRRCFLFISEPVEDEYRALISAGLQSSTSFIVVVRPDLGVEPTSKIWDYLDRLHQWLIRQEETSSWPGTDLLLGKATLFEFALHRESAAFLMNTSARLYEWTHDRDLPEDLALMRADGTPWLITIAHEREAYLNLSRSEREELAVHWPALDKILERAEEGVS